MHYLPTLDEINEAVDNGLVSVQEHPEGGIFIYNYTAKTQYEQAWNPTTLACRGLILDAEGNIVARPFPKFFNFEEHSASDLLFQSPYTVAKKLDGSLGILYTTPSGERAIATRGSFVSDQAQRATMILREKYDSFVPYVGYTYLFEIIYPENKIVIDYGGLEDIVLIAIIQNATGNDHHQALRYSHWPGDRAEELKTHDGQRPEEVRNLGSNDGTQEVFVLRFLYDNNHVRVKVKFSEYVRIHRLISGLSTKVIWEYLQTDPDSLDDLLQDIPDEFYQWAKQIAGNIMMEFRMLYTACEKRFARLIDECFKGEIPDPLLSKHRKAFAEAVLDDKQNSATNSIMFMMLDDNTAKVRAQIWKQVCPPYSRPMAIQDKELTNA